MGNFLDFLKESNPAYNRTDCGIYGSGTTDYIAKFTGADIVGDSAIYEKSGNVGIGTIMITGRKLGVLATHTYAGHFYNTCR
jgi:hypothetical protein